MYRNPWTNNEDSPINYSQPAVNIIADAVNLATSKLCGKLKIYDADIMSDIMLAAYERSIATIKKWDSSHPLYNHCWQCVHSCYPEVLRKHNRNATEPLSDIDMENIEANPQYINGSEKSERDEIEADIEFAQENGISPAFSSYDEYKKHYIEESIKESIQKHF